MQPDDEPSYQAFLEVMEEQRRWAELNVSLQEASDAVPELCSELARFDRAATVPAISSLLTLPEYQSNCVRLELLVALAVIHCRGKRLPNGGDLSRWFEMLGDSLCTIGEDPSEDVFVSLVQSEAGDYRILEGVWESAGFYTQRVFNVVATMPDRGALARLKGAVRAMLQLSDLICERSGLQRYQLGEGSCQQRLDPSIGIESGLSTRARVRLADLKKRGIQISDLAHFVFKAKDRDSMLQQQVGRSALDLKPLILQSDELVVALPTAISSALREFVISFVGQLGLTDSFDQALAAEYSHLLSDTRILGAPPIEVKIRWSKVGNDRGTSFAFEADKGHYIAFHLFLPSLRHHADGGLKDVGRLTDDIERNLEAAMRSVEGRFGSEPGFRRGLHVVVGCGWGKGFAGTFGKPADDRWWFESISGADLIRLSSLSDIDPIKLFRLQVAKEAIEREGVRLFNVNGVLNLLGWVRHNNGHLVPHAQLSSARICQSNPLLLNTPTNLLRDVRAEADSGCDRHSIQDEVGKWHDVRRVDTSPIFKSSADRRVYACVDCVDQGRLTAVYEGRLQLWVEIEANGFSSRDVAYRLWEMARTWIGRIGVVLDAAGVMQAKNPSPLRVRAVFEDSDKSVESVNSPVPADLQALCAIEVLGNHACRATFRRGFILGFRVPENIAERAFVKTLVAAFLRLASDDESKAEQVVGSVVPNDRARSFHLFQAQGFIDYVRGYLPRDLIEFDEIDDATLRLGLGWKLENAPQDGLIEGRDACTNYLNRLVSVLVADVVNGLSRFDRKAVLVRLLLNCEKARHEEAHWKRTSSAVLALHTESEATIRAAVDEISRFARASVVSRVLAEIAVCASPLAGGQAPSNLDFAELMARVALIVRFGGLSDAIRYSALTPKLKISPLGDVLFQDDFGNTVVEPMLVHAIGKGYVSTASHQRQNYEAPRIIQSTSDAFDREFWNAWIGEYGFDLDDARRIVGAIEDLAIERRTAVLEIKMSDLVSLAESQVSESAKASKFIQAFILAPRARWEKPDRGHEMKDIYPWRFGRRLSLVARPILQLSLDEDPVVLIAPGILRQGFAYVVDGAFNATLDQSFFFTPAMKNDWWGKAGEGHSFNSRVANALESSGWTVKENIGLPEVLRTNLDRDYGDVDVLAWRPDGDSVLVIESKDLSFARNYSEIAALLSDFQGAVTSKGPDRLRRHLDRVALLSRQREAVASFTGISSPTLVSCLVCSGVVPMQYAKIDALKQTFVGDLDDLAKEYCGSSVKA